MSTGKRKPEETDDQYKARIREYHRQWREKNRDKARAAVKKYEKANKDKRKETARISRQKDPEKNRQAQKRYREKHPGRVKESQKRFDESRKDSRRQYYLDNKDHHNAVGKAYRDADPERERQRVKDKTAEYLKKSYCHNCPSPRLPNSNTYCERHWFGNLAARVKNRSGLKFNSLELSVELKELIEAQNYTCPYTGIRLVPGVNASLDHVLPISRYPELGADISNLEWVSLEVNLAKRDKTREEFIELCVTILKNRGYKVEHPSPSLCK